MGDPPIDDRKAFLPPQISCSECGGTGLVCGHEPEIGSGNCCVDYANAICPTCKGTGRIAPEMAKSSTQGG